MHNAGLPHGLVDWWTGGLMDWWTDGLTAEGGRVGVHLFGID